LNTVALAVRQIRSENRTFWRNPASAFFTFAFPLMFLVIFTLIFGNEDIEVAGGSASGATFFVPAIAAFSVITACYTNVAMTVTFARDQGILKRVRGTPLPAGAFLAGKIGNAILIGVLLVMIVVSFGRVFYSVEVPGHTLPAFVVTLAVGSAAFCALGLALTGFVSNAEAAPAVVQASILPLLFISDIFIRSDNTPSWVNTLAGFFPIKHFSEALQTAFNPFETGSGFEPKHLAVMAAWGVVGLIVAMRKFEWEPRR
jgi:ABC-2 type transport system permease protein